MEIKRYSSIYFLVREMKKDLFNIDLNNSADDECSLLSPQSTIHEILSECKNININKWKKLN
jgi:hypothetical protein